MLQLEPPRRWPQPRPQRRPQQMSPSRRESSSRKRSPPAQRRHLPRPATRQPARCRCPWRQRMCVPSPETPRFRGKVSADAYRRVLRHPTATVTTGTYGVDSTTRRFRADVPASLKMGHTPSTPGSLVLLASAERGAPQLRARKWYLYPRFDSVAGLGQYHSFRDKSHVRFLGSRRT